MSVLLKAKPLSRHWTGLFRFGNGIFPSFMDGYVEAEHTKEKFRLTVALSTKERNTEQ